tara:strand:+ start:180 stop:644 length:465 start_codon:yes stop_codon:yes gene_type:complete
MAFTGNFMCTSFKRALLDGEMDFSANTTDTFNIALYTNSASLTAATSDYVNNLTGEVGNGNGYGTGGKLLTISQAPTDGGSGTTVFLSFGTINWTSSTITSRGALIYRSNGANTNTAVAVLDFLSDKSSSNGTFEVQFPTNNATSAIIRIETPS